MSNEELLAAIKAYIDNSIARLDTKIDTSVARLDAKIDTSVASLDAKIDTSVASLDAKIDTSTQQQHSLILTVFEAVKEVARDVRDVKATTQQLEANQRETNRRVLQAQADGALALAKTSDLELRLEACENRLTILETK